MDEYKKVNRELIEKVQEMRIELGCYRKDLNKLNSCLQAEHQKRIEQEQHYAALVVRHFYGLLQEMSPGSNILKLLGVDEGGSGQVRSRERSASKRHSSAEILHGFRRRSQAVQGVIAVSPTRRSSASGSGASGESVELELDEGGESDPTLGAYNSKLNFIDEDEEESSREQRSEESSNVEEDEKSEQHQEEEDEEEEETIENVPKVRAETSIELRLRKRREVQVFQPPPSQLLRDVTNTPDQYSDESSPLPSSPRVKMRRGKHRKNSPSENEQREEPEESIAVARFAHNSGSATFGRLPEDASCYTSTSFAMTDLTMGNFEDAPSSTPCSFKSNSNLVENNSPRRSLARRAQINAQNNNNSLSACNSSSSAVAANTSRPRRQCTPSNLAEPKLRTKMRDESKDRKAVGGRKSKRKVTKT